MNLFEEFLYNLQYARGKSPKTIAAYKPHLDEFKKYVFYDKEVIYGQKKKRGRQSSMQRSKPF